MSIFVKEILNNIYNEKNSWEKDPSQGGIRNNRIKIYNFGNSKLLSIIHVKVDNQDIPLTYMDKYRLEKAVGWWYQNVELNQLLK